MRNQCLKQSLTARKAVFLFFLIVSAIFYAVQPAMAEKKTTNNRKVSTFMNPDFAFPETVASEAREMLDKSRAEGDEINELRALLQIVVADNMVSPDSVAKNIQLIRACASDAKEQFAGFFHLLIANIYKSFYQNNRYVYDHRDYQENDTSLNPAGWSATRFAIEIERSVREALKSLPEARKLSPSKFSGVFTDTKTAERLGLGAGDILAANAVSVLTGMYGGGEKRVIPFYPITDEGETASERCGRLALQIAVETTDYYEKRGIGLPLMWAVSMRSSLMKDDEERREFLKKWSERFMNEEGEGYLLHLYRQSLYEDNKNFEELICQLYRRMETWVKKYPTGWGSDDIRNDMASISAQRARCEYPRLVVSGDSIPVDVTLTNAKEAWLHVYKLKNESEEDEIEIKGRLSGFGIPVAHEKVASQKTIPFTNTQKIRLAPLGVGQYVVIVTPGKEITSGSSREYRGLFQIMNVSDIALVTASTPGAGKSAKAYVVDSRNQRPVNGATVECWSYGRKPQLISSGVTSEEGYFLLPESQCRIVARYKGSKAKANYYYNGYLEDTVTRPNIIILTDLGIYHPGDTLRFVAIGWTSLNDKRSLLKQKNINFKLRDTNGNVVDTLALTTDLEGRTSGNFTIPADGPLGMYMLDAEFPAFKNRNVRGTYIQVADYKAPAFMVSLKKESSSEDEIEISGIAATYAGLPVTESKVEINVNWTPSWRWGGSSASWTTSMVTNNKGEFILRLPTENLKSMQWRRGIFSLTATVTDPSGETQKSDPLRFFLGDTLDIYPEIPKRIKVESDSLKFNVMTRDLLGLPVVSEVEYKIISKASGDVVTAGQFESPLLTLPSDLLPSGSYLLFFGIKDGKVKENDSVKEEIVVWRTDDLFPPVETPLWVPETEMTVSDSSPEVSVTVGSSWKDSWILCEMRDGAGRVSGQWIPCDGKNLVLPVTANGFKAPIAVTLSGMHNFKQNTETVIVKPRKEEVNIKTISFRDRLVPGNYESWRFMVSCNETPLKNSPVMAVMTNKSLESLAPFRWLLPARGDVMIEPISLSHIWNGLLSTSAEFNRWKWKNGVSMPSLTWQTYGYPLSGGMTVTATGGMMKNMMVMRSSAKYDMAAVKEEASDAAVLESQVEGESGSGQEDESQEWRGAEKPLAFFSPMLKTDAKGDVEIEFKVPDFNTTWHFQIAAYDSCASGKVISREVVAAKKVIVRSNLPRFLRTGDKGIISAMAYNNSNEVMTQDAEIVVRNADTGEVLGKSSWQDVEMKPGSGRGINVEISVPFDCTSIIVEARTNGGGSSDGERGALVVLPNTTPVEEATVFYLKPGATEEKIRIPSMPATANVELNYNLNPMWNCLRALSTLREPRSKDAISVAEALYSNLTSARLLESYPELALKPDSLAHVTENLVDQLKSLQNSDGGWSWCQGMTPSLFITRRVLSSLVSLHRQGLLDSAMREMTVKGLRWGEEELVYATEKNKGIFSTGMMLQWMKATDGFDGQASQKYKKLRKRALDSISAGWRNLSLSERATAAVVLRRAGMKREIPLILESLQQTAAKSAVRGWWFDNDRAVGSGLGPVNLVSLALEAFAESDPHSEAVEGFRQWILLQSETTDWVSKPGAVEVVDALLSYGSEWNGVTAVPSVKIGNKKIDIPGNIQSMGTAVVSLKASEVSNKTLTITKNSESPAWGGVLAKWIAPIRDVRDEAGLNLQVTKKIYKVVDGKLEECQLSVGDLVRVVLSVECEKAMDYVTVTDNRSAALEPADQISGMTRNDGIPAYRSVSQTMTKFFVEHLPKGTWRFVYDCYVDREGDYASGIAVVNSEYSPIETAHSGGSEIVVQ